jgi:superfamily II DNA/RNA helicase
VLSPTRELALQIETEVNKLHYKGIRRYTGFYDFAINFTTRYSNGIVLPNNGVCIFFILSVCVYGGSDRRAQIDTVRSGVEIVIGIYTYH